MTWPMLVTAITLESIMVRTNVPRGTIMSSVSKALGDKQKNLGSLMRYVSYPPHLLLKSCEFRLNPKVMISAARSLELYENNL